MVWTCASGQTGQRVVNMELPGRRRRGRIQEDVMEENRQRVGVTKEDAGIG